MKYIFLILFFPSILSAQVNSVCLIRTEPFLTQDKRESSSGSGSFLSEKRVLTAFHVVESTIKNKTQNLRIEYKNTISPAFIIKIDKVNDLALIESENAINCSPILLSDVSPDINDELINWGHSYARWKVFKSSGPLESKVIFKHSYTPEASLWYKSISNCQPGMSGGPVTKDAKLVGVISSINDSNTATYFSPIEKIKEFLQTP